MELKLEGRRSGGVDLIKGDRWDKCLAIRRVGSAIGGSAVRPILRMSAACRRVDFCQRGS